MLAGRSLASLMIMLACVVHAVALQHPVVDLERVQNPAWQTVQAAFDWLCLKQLAEWFARFGELVLAAVQ